jgi:hypothetical protein
LQNANFCYVTKKKQKLKNLEQLLISLPFS